MLVYERERGSIIHSTFGNLFDFIPRDFRIILNDTKVIPARLIGVKEETGAVIELLLLKDLGNDVWECLSKPAKRLKIGTIVTFGNGELKGKVVSKYDEGLTHVKLLYNGILMEILDRLGTMPLPPYIHEKLEDQSRYQTVYAKNIGSAAAPTAGLHFTKELLKKIEDKGIIITYVTLHVGLGTFRPVEVNNILDHHMHSEFYVMNDDTANILNKAKEEGRRIVAVGTTSTRTLEAVVSTNNGKFIATSGNTEIFIYPGYEFKAIDCLITNFHLPKSTLVMLVSALAGREHILASYKEAVREKYRFFSFGDAMFITNDLNKD